MAHGIFVPLDGSPLAAQALPHAGLIAQLCHAEIILCQVMSVAPQSWETYAHAAAAARVAARQQLGQEEAKVRKQAVMVAVAVEHGVPATTLLECARDYNVSLIVMVTHGRSGLSRWVMGSVAEQVLRATRLPALLLSPRALAAGTPARLQQRVLVPVDGSELSREIFPVVKVLAGRLGAPMTLVQALDPGRFLVLDGAPGQRGVALPSEVVQVIQDRTEAGLQQRAKEWRAEGLDVDVVVERGQPADVITNVASRLAAGWIAMASHGRGGLGGQVLGSTALAVLSQTPLPVLFAAVPKPPHYHVGDADEV